MPDQVMAPETGQAVKMAELAMDMRNVKDSLSEIQKALAELVKIDKDISGIMLQSQQINKDIKTIWDRYDAVKVWQGEVDKTLNKASGGRAVVNVVLSFVQVVVIGFGGWLFLRLDDARTDNIIQAQQIIQLKQDVESLKRGKP